VDRSTYPACESGSADSTVRPTLPGRHPIPARNTSVRLSGRSSSTLANSTSSAREANATAAPMSSSTGAPASACCPRSATASCCRAVAPRGAACARSRDHSKRAAINALQGATVTHYVILRDLAIIFAVSLLVIWVFYRIKLPALPGFIVAGVVLGPNALGLVSDVHQVESLAEVGVILLLFTIGIEFSLSRLREMGRQVVVGGGSQVILTTALSSG